MHAPRVRGASVKPHGEARITRRGACFALIAAGLTAAGALRAELGALIAGSGLGAAVLLSLAGVLAEGLRQKRALAADPEALLPRLSPVVARAPGGGGASFRVENRRVPQPRSPGISAWAEIRTESAAGRSASASVALPPVGSESGSPFPGSGRLLRGVYRGRAALVAGDAFGFWRSERVLPGSMETAVLPEPSHAPASAPRGAGGRRSDPSDHLIRGEERLDSRPYLPGDDPRRIHWKLYARFGDLFVRPGDPTPPPRGTMRVFLDAERPGWLVREAGEAYLDILASAVLDYVRTLEARGIEVRLSSQGVPDAPADPSGRLYWLADLAWAPNGRAFPDLGPEPLVLFGAPGSAGRGGIFASRKAGGLATALFVPDLPKPIRGSGPARFFLETGGEGRSVPGRAFEAAFRRALAGEEDLARAGRYDVRVF